MNWRLIALLAGFGPMIGLLWPTIAKAGWLVIPLLLVVVPVACSSWIVTGTRNARFRHGFVAGLLIGGSTCVVLMMRESAFWKEIHGDHRLNVTFDFLAAAAIIGRSAEVGWG